MSKQNDKEPQITAHENEMLARDGYRRDANGDYYDEHGNLAPDLNVASTILVDEMDIPPAAKRADGLDGLFRPTRTEPNTMGQRVGPVPPGEPSSAFVRPGEPNDADGQIGTPAEWNAELPDLQPLPMPDPAGTDALSAAQQPFGPEDGWRAGPGVSPSPSEYAQAQARGAGLMVTLFGRGQDSLTPEGLKADHRAAHDGRYVTGPSQPPGTPAGPSHEVTQFDGSSDASMSAFIGSTRAPTPPSEPTVRQVPVEETRGSSL